MYRRDARYRLAHRASPETPECRRSCRIPARRTRGTITTPSRFNAVAAEAMKILAHASTSYAQIRAQRRC